MSITSTHAARVESVAAVLKETGARSVVDLGCGDGPLLQRLAQDQRLRRIVGVDIDRAALGRLEETLAAATPRVTVDLVAGDILAPAPAGADLDAAVLVEVIEHLEPTRLSVLEKALFRTLRPSMVVITTPNAEFNDLLGVPRHRHRHPDHRFEWGRAKFRAWARGVASRWRQAVSFRDVGGAHPTLGGPSQMAVFRRQDASA